MSCRSSTAKIKQPPRVSGSLELRAAKFSSAIAATAKAMRTVRKTLVPLFAAVAEGVTAE